MQNYSKENIFYGTEDLRSGNKTLGFYLRSQYTKEGRIGGPLDSLTVNL